MTNPAIESQELVVDLEDLAGGATDEVQNIGQHHLAWPLVVPRPASQCDRLACRRDRLAGLPLHDPEDLRQAVQGMDLLETCAD